MTRRVFFATFTAVAAHIHSKNQEVIAEALSALPAINTTKSQILDAYLKIAVKEGTTALSLTRLADELKISKQLVRYHMPDLDQAALELFKITAQKGAYFTQSRLDPVVKWDEKIPTWIEATFDWVVAYPDFAKFLLFMYHRASVDQEANALHKLIVQTGRARLKNILVACPKKKIQKNAELITRSLHQLMTASLIEMLSMDDLKNHSRYRKELSQSAEYLLEL